MSNLTANSSRHSSDAADWMTPTDIIEAARKAMGRITLDPMSSRVANQRVKADRIFTRADDCFKRHNDWALENIFLNPDGRHVNKAWSFLVSSGAAKFIYVGFSLEQLQTLQSISTDRTPHPLDFHLCIPKRRIAFVETEASRARRRERWEQKQRKLPTHLRKPFKAASSPSHGNFVCGLGMTWREFKDAFQDIGVCVTQECW